MKTEIINEMINGYKEAFIFAEPATDHNGEYIENLDDYDFSPSALKRITSDVTAFCSANVKKE